MAVPVAKAASLAHIARESSDIHRLSEFYKEVYNLYLLPSFLSFHNSFFVFMAVVIWWCRCLDSRKLRVQILENSRLFG